MKNKWFTRVRNRGPKWLLPILLLAAAVRYLRRMLTPIKWRLMGITVGKHGHLGPGLRSSDPSKVVIHDRVVIGERVRFASETCIGRLDIQEGVEVGRWSMLDHSGDLTLEPSVLISEYVTIYTHDHGYDPRSQPSASPLVIKEGSWIGAHAIILPSVSVIGAGAIIGAGAVVCEDVADGRVYVGPRGRQFKRKDLAADKEG